MLINKLFKKTLNRNEWNLCLRVMFCTKMPYYREMGAKLKITIPKLNDEILIEDGRKCLAYGIRLIPNEQLIGKEQKQKQNQKKRVIIDQQLLIGYEIAKNSRQTIDFCIAKKIAQCLQLDICLMSQPEPIQQVQPSIQQPNQSQSLESQQQPSTVLSLSRFREHIYRQYYTKQLKNKSKKKYLQNQLHNQFLSNPNAKPKNSSDKNKIKSIRIGEDVHINDLKNKQNQVNNWLQQGQTTIKVIASNDSLKSRKAIAQFIAMFDKQAEIVQEKIIPNPKKKPIVRVYAILQFQAQIEVDFDFINRRWRRRQAEIKLAQQGSKNKSSIFDIDFTKQGVELQKAYLAAFDEAGIPYPKEFNFLSKMDKQFEKQGVMSLVKSTIEARTQKDVQNEIQKEELTVQQMKARDRENRKIMQMRTVEDIIQEMEEMRSREYEMEQYEASRYKELEKQLTEMLRNASKYAQDNVQS